jgi:ketosteroid isomerase-like protein
MNNRWMAPVSALTVLLSLQACTRAPATDQDRASVQQLLDKYFESVKAADTKLASEVWWQSPDIVVVTPLGRFQGWENVRENLYVNFLQKAFSERNLQPSNLTIHVDGDAAWAVFDWTFTAKLAGGQPFTSKGWESHVYRRTDQGWRIVHLHYSAPPPRS